jgi:hypothetical protein
MANKNQVPNLSPPKDVRLPEAGVSATQATSNKVPGQSTNVITGAEAGARTGNENPTMFQTLASTTSQATEQVQSLLNNPCVPLKTDSVIMNTAIYLGEIVGSDILRRIIPTVVENKKECAIPPASELLGSIGDNIINLFSLYVVFSLILQNVMFGEYRVIILSILIISFLIAPIILGTVLYSIRYAFPRSREELPLRVAALAGSALPFGFLFFIAIQVAFIFGFEGFISNALLTIFVGVPIVMILTSLSKFLAPISILLLGPGIIPYLAGQSFLEFCG